MCRYSIIGVLILLLGHISASLASYEDLDSNEVSDASSSPASASYEAKEYEDEYKAAPMYRRTVDYSGEDGVPFVLPQVDDTVAYWESIYGTDDVPEFEEPPLIEGETIFMDLDDLVEDEVPETIQAKRHASLPIEHGEDSEESRPSGDANYQTPMATTNWPEFYDAESLGNSESSTALNSDKDGQVYGSEDSTSAVFLSSFNHSVKSTQRSESRSAVGMRASLDIDGEMESTLESPEMVRAPMEARSIKSNGQIEALGNSKLKIIQAKKDLVSLAASGASEAEIAEAAQKTFEAKQDLVDSVILSKVSAVQSKKALVDSLATGVHRQRTCCSTKTRSQSRTRHSSKSVSNSKRKVIKAKKDFIQTAVGGGSQVELNDALIETLEAKKDLLDSIISSRTENVEGDEQEFGSAIKDFGLGSFLMENNQGISQITSNVDFQGSLQSILDLKLKVLQAKRDLIRTMAERGSQEEINDALIKTLEAKKNLLDSVVSIGAQTVNNGVIVSTLLDIGLDSLLNEDDQVISLVATKLLSPVALQTFFELTQILIEAKGNLIQIAAARGSKSELIEALVKTLAAKKDLLNSIIPAGSVNLDNDTESVSPRIDLVLATILNSDPLQNSQISGDLRSILDSKKKLIQAKGNLIKTALARGNQSELNNAFLEILEAKRDLLNSVVAIAADSVDNGETVSAVLDIGLDSLLNEDDQVISQVTADLQSRVSLETILQLKQKLIEAKGNLIRTVTARNSKSELMDALVKTLAAKKDLLNSIRPAGSVNFDNNKESASSSIDLGLDTILNSNYNKKGPILADLESILDSKKKLIQAKGNLIETAVTGGNQSELGNAFLETLEAKKDLVDSVISPPSKTINNEKDPISDAIDLEPDSFLNGDDQTAAPIVIKLRPSCQSNLDSKRKRIKVKKNSSCKSACENCTTELSEAVTKTFDAKKELLDTMRSTGTCRATKKSSNSVRESAMDSSSKKSFKNEGHIVCTSCQKNKASRQSVSNSKRKMIQAKKDLIPTTVTGGSEAELSEALKKTVDAKKELLDSVTTAKVETTNNARDSCHADSLQSLINLKRKLIQTKKGLLDAVTTGGNAANVNNVLIKALNDKKDLIDSIISQNDQIQGDLVSGLTLQSAVDPSSTLEDPNSSEKLDSQTEVTGEITTIQDETSSVQSTSTEPSNIVVEEEIGISSSSNNINCGNDISPSVNEKIQTDDKTSNDLQGSLTIRYSGNDSSTSSGSCELSGELDDELEIIGGTTKIQNEERSAGSSSIVVEGEIGISTSSNAVNQGNGISLSVNKSIQTDGQTSSDLQGSLTIRYSENDSSTSSGSCELSGELDDGLEITGGSTKIQNQGNSLQSTVASSIAVSSSSSSVKSSSQISLSVNKKIETNAQISSNLETNSATKESGRNSKPVNVVFQESLEDANSASESSSEEIIDPTNAEIASTSELSASLNTENHSTTDTATSNSRSGTSVELESSLKAKPGDGLQLIDSECALGQCGVSGKLHVNLNAESAINVQSESLPAVCLAEPTLSLNLQDEDQISQNTEIELQGEADQQELIQEGNNEDADEDPEPMPETNEELLTSDNDNQPNIDRTYYGENTQYSTGGGIFSNAHHRLINLDVNCTGKTAFMNPECQQLNANLGHPRDSKMSITLRTVKTYLSHGQELAQEMQNRAKWLCDKGFIPKLHTPAMLHLINSLATENTVEISQKSEFSLFGTKLLQRRLSSDFDVTPNTFLEFLQHHAFRVIGTGLCYIRPKRCPGNQMYRTFDGSCNNQEHPTWGQANTAFARVLPPRYSDGVHELPKSVTGADLPNPRLLSVQCFSRNGVSDRRLTLVVAQWGQLLAHDTAMQTTDQTAKAGIQCCADGKQLPKSLQHHSCLPIEIPKNDEFYSRFGSECMEFVRSMTVSREDCSLGPAEQINTVSSYLDASQLYGSDKETADRLRAFEGGRMKVSLRRGRELPPVMTNRSRYCDVMSPSEVCYQAGDVRVNQVPHLTVLQICLLREHNRIADELQRLNPHWEDERVFQETRKIVIAEYQHITYNEWLPVVIGKKYCQRYGLTPRNQGGMSRAYDPRVRATTINGFTTAAYRSFHSMLDGQIHLCPASREISHTLRLSNHYFRPQVIERNNNLDDLIRGMVTQPMQKSDSNFDPEITEYLFRSRSEFGLDLKSLDIQRGRDHGIPGYNRYREICGLTYATDFDDLRREIPLENINKLKKVYAHVDDIDLIVGAVMERKPPGSILGPIVRCLLGEQFYRSRIGDRYFYDNADQPHSFTSEQFEEIKKASLARLLCDTGDNIEEIQPEPFKLISCNNPLTSCSALPQLDLSPWQETECS
ncbi:uncharacterized protein LOC124405448 [Diprion similis]|uniref:uncharacterized protein LOC124405448 n=1 Tax=Diprion similis TaxID=362088 RepID=UPI001EF7CF9A|nr:uncharacterized protein LOC124405448 [Diprion similis]